MCVSLSIVSRIAFSHILLTLFVSHFIIKLIKVIKHLPFARLQNPCLFECLLAPVHTGKRLFYRRHSVPSGTIIITDLFLIIIHFNKLFITQIVKRIRLLFNIFIPSTSTTYNITTLFISTDIISFITSLKAPILMKQTIFPILLTAPSIIIIPTPSTTYYIINTNRRTSTLPSLPTIVSVKVKFPQKIAVPIFQQIIAIYIRQLYTLSFRRRRRNHVFFFYYILVDTGGIVLFRRFVCCLFEDLVFRERVSVVLVIG